MQELAIKILDPRLGTDWPLPDYATPGSAALDLRAMIKETLVIEPLKPAVLVSTGMAVHVENPNICGVILPRSGLGHKQGLILGNSVGLIDSDYQGELFMSIWNRGNAPITIEPGERIAQFVLLPVIQASVKVVKEFDQSQRGSGGFGHSGSA